MEVVRKKQAGEKQSLPNPFSPSGRTSPWSMLPVVPPLPSLRVKQWGSFPRQAELQLQLPELRLPVSAMIRFENLSSNRVPIGGKRRFTFPH